MSKYIIFEKNLTIKDGEIKSWAPDNKTDNNSTYYFWKNVSKIKKGDTIYFVSNQYFFAIGEAIEDSKSVKHNKFYDNEKMPNNKWSEDGYGVISKVTKDYSNKKICITNELEKLKDKKTSNDIKPFEYRNNKITAHQGGYCYELSESLENLILTCLKNYRPSIKTVDEIFNNDKFVYHEIDLNIGTKTYGTSDISTNTIKKGKEGENAVQEFFKKLNIDAKDVSEKKDEPADLILIYNNKELHLEVKNISNQNIHHIYLSDVQIQNLCQGKTRLCIYVDGYYYISKIEAKDGLFQIIRNNFNKIREWTINQYDGNYSIDGIAINIYKDLIEKNFISLDFLAEERKIIQELFK